jgi:hypothetical protein
MIFIAQFALKEWHKNAFECLQRFICSEILAAKGFVLNCSLFMSSVAVFQCSKKGCYLGDF